MHIFQQVTCGAGANASAAGSAAGNTPPHMNHMPRLDPSSSGAVAEMSHQASAQGKGRGQNPKAGRARGQGSANSAAPTPPMQILQPPPRLASATFTCAAFSIAISKHPGPMASTFAVMLSPLKCKILSTPLVLPPELCHALELWRLFPEHVCAVYSPAGKVCLHPTWSP